MRANRERSNASVVVNRTCCFSRLVCQGVEDRTGSDIIAEFLCDYFFHFILQGEQYATYKLHYTLSPLMYISY